MQHSKVSDFSLHDAQGRKYIDANERRALLKCAARMPPGVRTFAETLVYTGCRISEALSLAVGHIDLDNRVIQSESLKKRYQEQWRAAPIRRVLIERDGTDSETEQAAHTLHVMGYTPQAFHLIVQRQLMDEKKQDPQPDLLSNLFVDQDDESTRKGRYAYRALAANLDLQTNWDEHKVVHFYNQRGEASENRIKELRSDFGGAQLPCGNFSVNAAFFKLCASACNLLALLRRLLPAGWKSRRALVRSRLGSVDRYFFVIVMTIVCPGRPADFGIHELQHAMPQQQWVCRKS